jgi:hypothetical protein
MPFQAALPTWLAINNENSPYQSGQGDPITGYPYNAGGLNQGDYFDLTNDEAANASYTTNGILYNGTYRYVQVDSGATAANVKTGTVGYIRSGSTVKSVVVLTQGSGQTVGTYQVAANVGSGGGSGAIIQVVVTAANAITVSVLNGGYGYVSVPTFTLATGGTPGTVQAQLGISENIVTSADQALGTAGTGVPAASQAGVGPIHPVVFLNSITPGNYGFVQESGVATVAAASTAVQTQGYNAVVLNSASANGTMTTSVNTYSEFAIGQVLDPLPSAPVGTLFKIQMNTPRFQD